MWLPLRGPIAMNAIELPTIAVVGVLLAGDLAGLGGAAPADAPADNMHTDGSIPEHVGDGSVINELLSGGGAGGENGSGL